MRKFEFREQISIFIELENTAMKKGRLLLFTSILFLTFGITDLDFDNLNFSDNYKAYIFIILGGFLIALNFIYWKRVNKEK